MSESKFRERYRPAPDMPWFVRESEAEAKLAEKDAELDDKKHLLGVHAQVKAKLEEILAEIQQETIDLRGKLAEAQQEIERLNKFIAEKCSTALNVLSLCEFNDELRAKLAEAEARVEEEEQAYVTMMDLRDAEIRKRTQAERERDAYKKAKQENDERFMRERDGARAMAEQAEERAQEMRQFIEDCECECVEANHVTGLMTKRVCARCETLSAAPANQCGCYADGAVHYHCARHTAEDRGQPSRMEKLEARHEKLIQAMQAIIKGGSYCTPSEIVRHCVLALDEDAADSEKGEK